MGENDTPQPRRPDGRRNGRPARPKQPRRGGALATRLAAWLGGRAAAGGKALTAAGAAASARMGKLKRAGVARYERVQRARATPDPQQERKPKPIRTPAERNAARKAMLAEAGFLAASLTFIGAGAGLYGLFVILAPRPPEGADLWAVNRLPSVVILDRNGEELAARGPRYGKAVAVEDLPPFLIEAFLATEDRRFYTHRGVDIRGLARAAVVNFRRGAVVEGGSTITQQLARNLFLSPEQTYVRKAREALLAVWLEGRLSKDEILSLYLNRIYLGAGAYGVETAARTYFGKSAREVSLSEAAMLAGLPKAPSTLAPTQNPIGATERAEKVLANLVEVGAITEAERLAAQAAPPVVVAGGGAAELGYFFDYAAAKAREIAGPGAIDLVVRTTLDARMQKAAEAAVRQVMTEEARAAGARQAALVAYETSGAMRAMVGGVSYVESQFNRAVQAKRQPGSAFKPFVFAAAFENGMTPQTRFTDQPIDIEGWKPQNYTDEYAGAVRLTEAMAQSINTVAVQVSERVGRQKVVEMAQRLGLDAPLAPVPSIALGGANMTLDDLTSAYLPFARGGTRVEPYAIDEIADGRGRIFYQYDEKRPEPAIDPAVARDVSHVLYQVMSTGTGRSANLGARQAVGKTGTTNDWRDAWFVGYTPQLVAGVWVGNDEYEAMSKVTGGAYPAAIWKAFMTAAHEGAPRLAIDGAYPASNIADESALLGFYAEVAGGLRDVVRDGGARRGRRYR